MLVSAFYPPILGGAELQAQSLARALDSLGVRITVLTRAVSGAAAHEHDRGIEIFRAIKTIPLGPLWGVTYMWNTHRWLRRLERKWDLVHSQQVGLHSWSALRVARLLGRPCLVRCSSFGEGGDLATMHAQRFGGQLVRELRAAARVVALTESGAAEVLRYGIAASHVRVIPNGVDLRRFRAQPWPQVGEAEPLRLLFVGRLSREKGLDILLQALTMTRPRGRFRLRIVGTGNERASLHAQATAADLGSMVEFCGAQSNVVAQYAWSELVVVPSRFEGMPNVVLEAMACSRPVLGTRVNGTSDLIADGRDGWLVPSEDPASLARALDALANSRATLAGVGACGRSTVEGAHSIARIATIYSREYAAMLAEPPNRRP